MLVLLATHQEAIILLPLHKSLVSWSVCQVEKNLQTRDRMRGEYLLE